MTKNIILAGVGGQGILTIATIIDMAAMEAGLNIKQAEIHGMSQRGGAVQSHLRISDTTIYSDLIPKTKANLILSMEPMETLRYFPFLADDGVIVSSTNPLNNIATYPDIDSIYGHINKLQQTSHLIDAERLAKEAGSVKAVNIVMLGAASSFLELDEKVLKQCMTHYFQEKEQKIIDINLKAFELGIRM